MSSSHSSRRRRGVTRPRAAAVALSALVAAACSQTSSKPTPAEKTGRSAAELAVVTNGVFTNLYVYPDPESENWEQHLRSIGMSEDYIAQFSRDAIDAFSDRFMVGTWPGYFDPLYQYSGVMPPTFFGSGVVSKDCIQAAIRDENNNVIQASSIRSLANCHADGFDPSPQINLIFSPDLKVADVDPAADDGDMCAAHKHNAYHSGGLNVPNYTVLPLEQGCLSDLITFTKGYSHEVVETLSDPALAGFGQGTAEVGDLCEKAPVNTTIVNGDTVETYFSSTDDDCGPVYDPPSGSTSTIWYLGSASPAFHVADGDTITIPIPANAVRTNTAITQATLVVMTGDDALKAESGIDVTLQNGAQALVTTPNINGVHTWNKNETHSLNLNVTPAGGAAPRVQDITGLTIHDNPGDGSSWGLNRVALIVSFAADSTIANPPPTPLPVSHWIDARELPLNRFTSSGPEVLRLPIEPEILNADRNRDIVQLRLIISTGNDNLNGNGSDCEVDVKFADGTVKTYPNVNNGATWDGWSKHVFNVPLPADAKGGDVTEVDLVAQLSSDNWNVERVQLDATLSPAPAVTRLNPTIGAALGQNQVEVDGQNFATGTNNTQIFFGNTPASTVTCPTTTQCFATAPAGSGFETVTAAAGIRGTIGQSYEYGASSGGGGSCACEGVGLGGGPVSATCGQTTCGTDSNTYLCNAPGGTSGWTYQSAGCACNCSGTALGGGPVTVGCGQATCGADGNTYQCNAPGGGDWTYAAPGCGCACSGEGISGPVTVACGQTTIGTDGNVYVCAPPGGSGGWGACTCSGTGINGPVAVQCGQTTCGTDDNTYICDAPGGNSGWKLQANGCH